MLRRNARDRLRRPAGVVGKALDLATLQATLEDLGEAGERARLLDRDAGEVLAGLLALSPLTTPLVTTYVERLGRPLPDFGFDGGVLATTRGYAAHVAVEAGPGAYGAGEVPVLGNLPAVRNGRPPADLLNRVIRASRRGFEHIRAVDADVWAGLSACVTHRVHDQAGAEGPFADPVVVDALVRFGWVLRQVDLHYGQAPERR